MTISVTQPKLAGETSLASFDLSSSLAIGEAINAAVVTCVVHSGVDSNSASVISGAATINAGVVTQKVTGGIAGVTYLLLATASTSGGQTILCQGLLVVLSEVI